ncbi:hypothetical protein [Singulisphaera sp. PoT]|uniref:hypothetical protein n=1 Tax=Singulisphaera sp. PoT TaxID=3411797 RepID=UPI003BF463D1
MATENEASSSLHVAPPDTWTRLRRYAWKRGRQALRILLALVLGLIVVAAGALAWRACGLIGLPDIGDPFDLADVAGVKIPDDHNAFAFYRQAAAEMKPFPSVSMAMLRSGPDLDWEKVDPKLREWVESNRPALEWFRQGTDLIGGVAHPSDKESLFNYERMDYGRLILLAELEGSRLEKQGDMAGAWDLYRSILRLRVHLIRCGLMMERVIIGHNCSRMRKRLEHWAADPKTEMATLKAALADVVGCEPRPEWDVFSLKLDYLFAMRELTKSDTLLNHGDGEDIKFRIFGESLPPNLSQTLYKTSRFLRNEPERSRRVLRMAFANWVGRVEQSTKANQKAAVRATFSSFEQKSTVFLYPPGGSPTSAKVTLTPSELAERLVGALDAKQILCQWPWPSVSAQERRDQRALVLILAEELYRRDHGTPAPSETALVGPYLKHLPDDGTGDLDDGMIPTVYDPRVDKPAEPAK